MRKPEEEVFKCILALFLLVNYVWKTYGDVDSNLRPNQNEINMMFIALDNTIENTEAVFDLINEVFKKVNDLSKDIANFILDVWFLISKIDKQSKN